MLDEIDIDPNQIQIENVDEGDVSPISNANNEAMDELFEDGGLPMEVHE
tara:strand:- start:339 stop:485 length:147 start_codon:yes stop_codon:yes gene_type:complete